MSDNPQVPESATPTTPPVSGSRTRATSGVVNTSMPLQTEPTPTSDQPATAPSPAATPAVVKMPVQVYGGVQEDYVLLDDGDGNVKIYPRKAWSGGSLPGVLFQMPVDEFDSLLAPQADYRQAIEDAISAAADEMQRDLWQRGVLAPTDEITEQVASAAATRAANIIRDALLTASRNRFNRGG